MKNCHLSGKLLIPVLLLMSLTASAQTDSVTAGAITSKNRIGISAGFGIGFQDHDIFVLENNKNATISFGGGYGIGLTYGYEFTPYFDLTAEAAFQFSELKPVVKNADASFSRVLFSITPSYIYILNDEDLTRIRAGAGFDMVSAPEFEIEGSEVEGGFNDVWSYKSTFGFHITAVYEQLTYENYSYFLGLKYYNFGYQFSSGKNSFPASGDKLEKPDGSGIDFVFGINYLF